MAFKHKEAFCLMKYRDTAGNEEIIWNSRDGVTPFIITSRQGLEAQHVDWGADVFAPTYVPPAGSRIFIDMTREKAEARARRRVERYWDAPGHSMREVFPSKEKAIEAIAADIWHEGEAPDLVEVTVAVRKTAAGEPAAARLSGTGQISFGDGTWCERHWAPVRDGVYAGTHNGIAAAIALFQAVVNDDRFAKALGWDPDTGAKGDASPDRMNAELAKRKPLCCWIGEEAMKRIYLESAIGRAPAPKG